jgi:hypothetical protein
LNRREIVAETAAELVALTSEGIEILLCKPHHRRSERPPAARLFISNMEAFA